MAEAYPWLKALHVIAVISWMAGLFYLPRLFVYHAACPPGSERAELLRIMEQRLLRIIMAPAMGLSWLTGLALAWGYAANGLPTGSGWLAVKLLMVLAMSALQWRLAWHREQLARGENRHSERYFRILNEAPTVLMIIIVTMVVVKPF
jgi:putative membrane protein